MFTISLFIYLHVQQPPPLTISTLIPYKFNFAAPIHEIGRLRGTQSMRESSVITLSLP